MKKARTFISAPNVFIISQGMVIPEIKDISFRGTIDMLDPVSAHVRIIRRGLFKSDKSKKKRPLIQSHKLKIDDLEFEVLRFQRYNIKDAMYFIRGRVSVKKRKGLK